jgi:hypothetical protein
VVSTKNPLLGLSEQPQSPAAAGRKMFLETGERVFQDGQHQPSLRLHLSFPAKVFKILNRKKAVGLKQGRHLLRSPIDFRSKHHRLSPRLIPSTFSITIIPMGMTVVAIVIRSAVVIGPIRITLLIVGTRIWVGIVDDTTREGGEHQHSKRNAKQSLFYNRFHVILLSPLRSTDQGVNLLSN